VSCPDIYKDNNLKCYDFQQTVPYQSPEKISGHGYDSKNDVFSLGVMTYMMMYGEHPYMIESPVNFHMNKYIERLESFRD